MINCRNAEFYAFRARVIYSNEPSTIAGDGAAATAARGILKYRFLKQIIMQRFRRISINFRAGPRAGQKERVSGARARDVRKKNVARARNIVNQIMYYR